MVLTGASTFTIMRFGYWFVIVNQWLAAQSTTACSYPAAGAKRSIHCACVRKR